jgi:hypothetical protein
MEPGDSLPCTNHYNTILFYTCSTIYVDPHYVIFSILLLFQLF